MRTWKSALYTPTSAIPPRKIHSSSHEPCRSSDDFESCERPALTTTSTHDPFRTYAGDIGPEVLLVIVVTGAHPDGARRGGGASSSAAPAAVAAAVGSSMGRTGSSPSSRRSPSPSIDET